MADRLTVTMQGFDEFIELTKFAAPEKILRAVGKALYKMGKSDIQKLKDEQLSGGLLNIRSKGFKNAFKFRAADSSKASSLNDLWLNEWTGAKPFRIFETGGEIAPKKSRTLTILTDAARNGSGKRKYTQKQLKQMIDSGQAKIIETRAGPAVVLLDEKYTKSGKLRKGAKATILAWLKPRVVEKKRIDFFVNFEDNEDEHQKILNDAASELIKSMKEHG